MEKHPAAGDVVVELCGETMVLLPERAIWWPNKGAILVADPHFGKAATFRARGVPVPAGTTHEILSRLDAIINRTDPRLVVFLGDLLHAKAGRSTDMLSALARWREENANLELLLVRGNHDRHAGDPPQELRMNCVDAPFLMPPFAMAHHPCEQHDAYVIAGHIHPGVRLYGRGGLRERLPCFVIGTRCAVLPAFGEFTGLADTEPEEGTEIYAIAGDEVVAISG